MKKLFSTLLIVAMLGNSALANPLHSPHPRNNHERIAIAFDQFRYQMTVNINPADQHFRSKAMTVFKSKIAALQKEGVPADEIMEYMRNSILDSATRSDFDRLLSSMDVETISSEEAANIAMRFMAGKYQQGASYGGGGRASYKAALITLGIVMIGVATYFLIKHIKEAKAKTITQTVTETDVQTDVVTNTTTEVQTNTETVVNTHTVTSVETVNNTNTITKTETFVTTDTVTNFNTVTNYDTVTNYETVTNYNTITNTVTQTNTDTVNSFGYCCNGVVGMAVPASPTGCANGDALYWVPTESECKKLGPPNGWDD